MKARYPLPERADLLRTFKPLAYYASDPTAHLVEGRFCRATRTPAGPGTFDATWDDREVNVEFFGDGAQWLADRFEYVLGLCDDVSDFQPDHPLISKLWRAHGGIRIPSSRTLWHDVAFLIPGQRVSTLDAANQWASLCRTFSEPAPGPLDLHLPPAAQVIAKTHYTEFHQCGIERQRAENLRNAAKYIPRMENDLDIGTSELRRRLELIPGLGQWTSTSLIATTVGDPDSIILGDYAIPSFVTWAFQRQRVGTDAEMLRLLEPFRPHRYRVFRLIMVSGLRPPRHGARKKNPRIQRI